MILRNFQIKPQLDYLFKMKNTVTLIALSLILFACSSEKKQEHTDAQSGATTYVDSLVYAQEKHLKNVRMLTNGGDNAEAYFSFDDSMLVCQITNPEWGIECDQIFAFNWREDNILKNKPKMISTGKGRTTCSYFLPGDTTIVYASTHSKHDACPPVPERGENGAYVWPIYPEFDIYVANLEGEILDTLTDFPGYDAEATVSPKGDKIVFTSLRSGDLELYTMNIDGSDVKQITHDLGYDGGAFFSPDGSQLIFRASRPETEEEIAKYKSLLEKGLVEPTDMELFICNVDGSELRQLTNLGRANWAPFFHPSGDKVLFSSNHKSESGFPFNLFMINVDGTGLEQVTFDNMFDSFPMFSNDGKKLVFSSNRNNGGGRATNLFIADWVD